MDWPTPNRHKQKQTEIQLVSYPIHFGGSLLEKYLKLNDFTAVSLSLAQGHPWRSPVVYWKDRMAPLSWAAEMIPQVCMHGVAFNTTYHTQHALNTVERPGTWRELPVMVVGDRGGTQASSTNLPHVLRNFSLPLFTWHISFKIFIFLYYGWFIMSYFCCKAKCPVIYIHSFSHLILHHVPTQVTGYSSLCYTAGSHCLSIPNATVYIY